MKFLWFCEVRVKILKINFHTFEFYSCLMFTIDTHTHIIPESIPDFAKKFGYGDFITLQHHEKGKAWMMQGNKKFREIMENCWNPSLRVEEIAKPGEWWWLRTQQSVSKFVICTLTAGTTMWRTFSVV